MTKSDDVPPPSLLTERHYNKNFYKQILAITRAQAHMFAADREISLEAIPQSVIEHLSRLDMPNFYFWFYDRFLRVHCIYNYPPKLKLLNIVLRYSVSIDGFHLCVKYYQQTIMRETKFQWPVLTRFNTQFHRKSPLLLHTLLYNEKHIIRTVAYLWGQVEEWSKCCPNHQCAEKKNFKRPFLSFVKLQ